jgi:LacI family transcriptional regulator
VAAKAGVSVTTVSHVLSSRRPVSEATRAKVLKVIEELNYRPNELARSMRAKRTSTIALIVPDITNPFYTAAARGLQDTIRAASYHCIVTNTEADRQAERDSIRQLLTRVDGIVISGSDHHDEDIQPIIDAGIPLVLLGADVPGPGFDVVTNADFGSGALAAEYLVDKGYQRIAFITAAQDFGASARRVEGYRSVVDAHGEGDPNLVIRSTGTLESGTRCMISLLDLAEPPDAVICINDVVAIGAMYGAGERDLRIPQDVAVIGFDDIEAAALVSPKLTTMATASLEHGRVAGEMLLRRIEDRTIEPQRAVFPAQLVQRESA